MVIIFYPAVEKVDRLYVFSVSSAWVNAARNKENVIFTTSFGFGKLETIFDQASTRKFFIPSS